MLLWLWACEGESPTPSRIELDVPVAPILDDTPIHLHPVILDMAGHPMAVQAEVAVSPEQIAEVTPEGVVTCKNAGNVAIQFQVQKVERRAWIRCRRVARLNAPSSVSLSVGQKENVAMEVLDASDQPVMDIVPTYTSSDESVVKIEEGQLLAVGSGVAEVVGEAGGQKRTLRVEVKSVPIAVVPSTWSVGEGAVQSWYLPSGSWTVEVNVKTGGPVGVEVRGGGCTSGVSFRHSLKCKVESSGFLQIRNPVDGKGGSYGGMVLKQR